MTGEKVNVQSIQAREALLNIERNTKDLSNLDVDLSTLTSNSDDNTSNIESIASYQFEMRNRLRATFGAYGHEFITNSAFNTDNFCAIQAIGGDVTLDYSTYDISDNSEIAHTSITIPDGVTIYGNRLTGVEVASGTLLAYYAIH